MRKRQSTDEQAAKLHKEAVKYYESGDNKTAALHSYIAHGHTEQSERTRTHDH